MLNSCTVMMLHFDGLHTRFRRFSFLCSSMHLSFFFLNFAFLSLAIIFTHALIDLFLFFYSSVQSYKHIYIYTYIFVNGLPVEHDFYQGYDGYVVAIQFLSFFFVPQRIYSELLLISTILTCNGQFLTPAQLRERNGFSYSARTHYEMSGGRRTDTFNRINPDNLLRGLVMSMTLYHNISNVF